MKGAANTTVTIMRATETDSYGDEVDSQVPLYTGVPVSIVETNRRTYLPAEQAHRVVRGYSCQVGREVDLRKGDRLQDEGSSRVYVITDISEPLAVNGILPDFDVAVSLTN